MDKEIKKIIALLLKEYTKAIFNETIHSMNIEKYITVDSNAKVGKFNKAMFISDLRRLLDRKIKDVKL